MTPAAFVFLDKLPLTPGGKIDRKALPAPDLNSGGQDYVAPRTDIEARLAQIWADVLGIRRVSIEDNFFDLGGHSLLAMQVIACVRQAFDIALTLRSLFESPTVAGLATQIRLLAGKPVINERDEGEI